MKPVVLGAARDGSALFRLEVIGKLAEALKEPAELLKLPARRRS